MPRRPAYHLLPQAYHLLPLTGFALLPTMGHATVHMTAEQAQAAMYPGKELRADFRDLTPDQVSAIRKASGESPLSKQFKAWRSPDGGWFIVDEVVGKPSSSPTPSRWMARAA